MKRILVTDGHSRAALQIIRSLGKLGLEVFVSEKFKLNPSFFSKYAKGTFVYPDPNDEENFIHSVANFCKRNNIKIIFPVVDECLITLVKNKNHFPGIKIPFASYKNLSIFRDKGKTMLLCKELGLPHPKTYFLSDKKTDKFPPDITYPAIIKPRLGSGSRGIKLVNNLKALEKEYPILLRDYGSLIVQEYIPHGGAFGVEMLFDSNGLVCNFVHKRLREYPVSGGPSTCRVSTSNKFMEFIAHRLVNKLKWQGPAMVEFRVDSRDNIPRVMEVNGRYWGSLRCSIVAGVDFPKYHYFSAINNKNKFKNYESNVCARWEVGEIMWLLFSKGNFFDKLRAVGRNLSKDYFDFLTRDDPLPFLISLIEASSYLFSRKERNYSINRGW